MLAIYFQVPFLLLVETISSNEIHWIFLLCLHTLHLGCRISKDGASTVVLVQHGGKSLELPCCDTEVRCQGRNGRNSLASPAKHTLC